MNLSDNIIVFHDKSKIVLQFIWCARIRIRNNTHLNIRFKVSHAFGTVTERSLAPGQPFERGLSGILHAVYFYYNGQRCRRRWRRLSMARSRTFVATVDSNGENKVLYVRETSSRSTCDLPFVFN